MTVLSARDVKGLILLMVKLQRQGHLGAEFSMTDDKKLVQLHFVTDYFGKRKQVTKVTFLVKEQNVSVIPTDVNGIS